MQVIFYITACFVSRQLTQLSAFHMHIQQTVFTMCLFLRISSRGAELDFSPWVYIFMKATRLLLFSVLNRALIKILPLSNGTVWLSLQEYEFAQPK